MMKKQISIIFLLFLSGILFAQKNGKIEGRIFDSSTEMPLEFVTVSLFDLAQGTLINGGITNINGSFILENIPLGKYKLKVSYIGYLDVTKEIKISEGKTNLHVSDILLKENSQLLSEIEVVGQVAQVKFDIDKKTFMVNQSALSPGMGASDVLQNIPSVNVDNDGNISLRNNGNVEVWINGKPSGLTAENRGQILEQLPAESIESIEIITNPSAKYNPEGSSGIINVVLKKDRKGGYYGNVALGFTTPFGTNLSGNVNYSNDKIDAFLNLSYRRSEHHRDGYTNRESYGSDTVYLNQTTKGLYNMNGLFLRTGINYQINKKNSIGISAFGMLSDRNSETENFYKYKYDNDIVFKSYTQNTLVDRQMNGFNSNIDYKYLFNKKGHEFTASAGYNQFAFNADFDYLFSGANPGLDRMQASKKDRNTYSLQADYVLPMNDISKFEAGYKSVFSFENSLTSAGSFQPTEILNIDYLDDFLFNQQTHAFYSTYKNRFKTIGYQIGLRAEATLVDWANTQTKGDYNRFDFFPSVFLSKKINETNEFQLSLTRRINRPDGRRINPFRNISDSTNIVYGNPDLSPEFAAAYEINHIKTWDAHSIASSIYYRETNDVIQQIKQLVQPSIGNEYLETTFKNITSSKNAGVEISLKNKILKKIDLTSTFNAYYSLLAGNTEYNIPEAENLSCNLKLIGNVNISKGFTGQLTANYRTSELISQGESKQMYTVDLGLRKSFTNNWIVSLSMRDVFNSRKFKTISYGPNFYQESLDFRQGRVLSLNVSYGFGNMKEKNNKKKNSNGQETILNEGDGF